MKDSLLLIMEEDLSSRFSFFQQQTEIPFHVLKLKTSLKTGKIATIYSRLTYKKNLESEYQSALPRISLADKLFISNPEGFIAKNIIYYIRRDFPQLKIVSLQHGIFSLNKKNRFHFGLKKVLNFLSKLSLNYFIAGDGFGDKSTDKYIVYNRWYKEYLLGNGWDANDVLVSSYLLKGVVPVEKVEIKPSGTAVFFLQCLHKLGVTDEESERLIISTVVKKLSKTYERILIKQHPYADVNLPELPSNVEVIKVTPPPREISFVVSAFSTALLEYEQYGIPYSAIFSRRLKVDRKAYEQFAFVHHFDHAGDEFLVLKNELRSSLPIFFEVGEKTLENL